jgi:hypothetical protein
MSYLILTASDSRVKKAVSQLEKFENLDENMIRDDLRFLDEEASALLKEDKKEVEIDSQLVDDINHAMQIMNHMGRVEAELKEETQKVMNGEYDESDAQAIKDDMQQMKEDLEDFNSELMKVEGDIRQHKNVAHKEDEQTQKFLKAEEEISLCREKIESSIAHADKWISAIIRKTDPGVVT